MKNTVRNAHAWAALLLLAAACGDSGGGDDDKDAGKDASVETDAETDAETPEDEGGTVEDDGGGEPGGGDPDGGGTTGGGDATVMMDAQTDADTTDTGVTTDTGTGGDDAGGGADTGVDSGPVLPTGCAETAVVAATGATITSSDTRFSLTLAGAALSADSTVRVCVIAAAGAPSNLDGRVGDAYEITTTPAATFSAATATFRGHSALPAVDATAVFDPVTVRVLPAGGAVADGTGAVLRMSKRALAADTVTTLTATIAGPGHVYVAPLEAAGIYHVDMRTPTKTAFVTGEIIDFSTIVTVTGAPVGARVLEAEVNGCEIDPINYPNPAGVVNQPGAVTNNPNCTGNYVAVSRVGGPTGNIVGGSAVGGAALTGGATYNMRDHDNTPLGLYCRFPRAGKGAARLFFKTGATVNLEVVKDIEVTCTYSGDLVAIHDEVPITRGGGSDYVVGTTYTPRAVASISPGITYTALAPDAVTYAEPAAILSAAGPTSFSAAAKYVTGTDLAPIDNPTNSVTFNYATDRYTASIANGTGFFRFLPRAELRTNAPGGLFDCYPPSSADLSLQLSDRNGSSSTVAILDGSIDLVSIRVRVPGTGAATIVQRLLDATKLGRYQAVPFLTASQQTAVPGTPSEYAVGFYRLAWDESRRIWDDGRIVPVACGMVLMFEAADVVP